MFANATPLRFPSDDASRQALESAAALLTAMGPTADRPDWPQKVALRLAFDFRGQLWATQCRTQATKRMDKQRKRFAETVTALPQKKPDHGTWNLEEVCLFCGAPDGGTTYAFRMSMLCCPVAYWQSLLLQLSW